MKESDFEAISTHSTVLYILSGSIPASQAGRVAYRLVKLGGYLVEMGALAVKCESSGIAHSATRWQELSREAGEDKGTGLNFWQAVFCAYVRLPLQSDTDLHSCGMHLLGQPDMIVSSTLVGENGHAADEAVELFTAFGLYLLAEVDDRGFVSGHTFRASAAAKQYRVRWEPCEGYDEDDFFFNPYGRWRFVTP